MALTLKRTSSIHIATKRSADFQYIDTDALVDYPSEWFARNPGSKPPVSLQRTTATADELYKAAKGGIRAMGLTLSTAKLVLYDYGLTMTDSCLSDWISYGVVIGTQGEDVNPWSLVEVSRGENYQPTEQIAVAQGLTQGPSQVDPTTWTGRSVVLYILCVYRLLRVTNPDYREILIVRMEQQLSAEGGQGMKLSGAVGVYAGWISDRNFLKLVAAYDMFLYNFNDHEDGILRMGSLGSRFRDCAGLLSFGYAMTILNIDAGSLMDWIFINTMGEEMLRLTKEGQESGNKDSYFPYQSDFHLVSRSAYSSNANPYLFHWIHMFGTLIGHKRSINARYNFEGSIADVGLNAIVLVWAFARGGELAPQFSESGVAYGLDIEPAVIDEDGEEQGIDTGMTPEDKTWIKTQGRDPSTWYALLKSNGFRVPPVVSRVIRRQRERIGETREDSVGAYVKEHLVY